MWNRFAPRLRRIIAVALEEAGRRGHDSASAEHILLAVCADPASGGAITLRRCGLKLPDIISRIDALEPTNGSPRPRADSLEPSALHLLDIASSEAQRLGHDHVGTEHITLVLPKLDPLPIAQLLRKMGLTATAAQDAVQKWLAQGMPRELDQTPRNQKFASLSLRKLKKLLRFPALAWKIYVRKSLGHPGFVTNPYPLYRWLRTHEPVRKDPLAPVWILTRYDDIAAMLRDPRYRKDPFAAERLPRIVWEQLGVEQDRVDADSVSMLFLDPPQHTRVRSAFARAFTPASLAALRPRIELICRNRLDRVHASGQMELIADLAYPLPVIVIAEMLGFPAEDYSKFKTWSDAMTAGLALNATAAQHAKAAEARDELHVYFDRVVVPRKDRPADSLISRLLEIENQPNGLAREEIFTNSVLLLAAGHETTTNLIGNGVLALMKHRDQWQKLVANPALVDSAVEEMLRYDSPVQWTSRVAGQGIELAGKSLAPSEIILGCVGAANRDPSKFPDPEKFDISRPDIKHLSFGSGVHFCLGAALARMEAQIALSTLVERYPRLRWIGRKLTWMKGLTFRGVTSLPLALE
jgi:cytochrome P450